jgi:pilus assembly protein CpaF
MSRSAVYEVSLRYFLQPINEFLDDESVSEVMVNGPGQIFIERAGKIVATDAQFENEDALRSAVNNLAQSVGREIDEDHPVLDARLPDGSRVHAIIPPSSRVGTCLTIRKFFRSPLKLEDLVRFGSLTKETQEFLEICVHLKKNVLISGGTGSGKTSLLGALTAAIPESERIIVIEDTSELRLHQTHCLYLEVQPGTRRRAGLDIRQLFRSSLRMRPDRIIVGEVRGGEALDLVQSMISGHAGSLSTVHASSAYDSLVRLETLSLMSDVEIPVYVARAQVASAIDVIVQLTRSVETGKRLVTRISEARGLTAENQYVLEDLFSLRPVQAGDSAEENTNLEMRLQHTGAVPVFSREPFEQGIQHSIDLTSQLWTRPS